MNVDLWVVFVWPVIVFFVCAGLVQVGKVLRPRITKRYTAWRAKRDALKREERRKRDFAFALVHPEEGWGKVSLGDVDSFIAKLKEQDPARAERVGKMMDQHMFGLPTIKRSTQTRKRTK